RATIWAARTWAARMRLSLGKARRSFFRSVRSIDERGRACHNRRGQEVNKQVVATLVIGVTAAWMLLPRAAYSHNPTTTTVLFNREIASLLQRKCVQCHAEGKLAMPLVTYAQTP